MRVLRSRFKESPGTVKSVVMRKFGDWEIIGKCFGDMVARTQLDFVDPVKVSDICIVKFFIYRLRCACGDPTRSIYS